MNSGLWSNSQRKTVIKPTFSFPAEEESVYIRKKSVGVNSTGHLHASFS